MKRYFLLLNIIICFFHLSQKAKAQNNQVVTNGNSTTPIIFASNSCSYTWTNDSPKIGLATSGVGDIPPFKAINIGNTAIIATIKATPLIGKGSLYVANSGDGTVSAINVNTNLVTSITVGSNPVWVTVNHSGNKIYVANFQSNSISVIDAGTNTVTSTITSIMSPSCIKVSPDDNLIYVTNLDLSTVSIINTSTEQVVGIIKLRQPADQLCLSNDGSKIYTEEVDLIEVFDATTYKQISYFTAGGIYIGIKMSKDGSRIYFADQDYKMYWVIDSTTLTEVGDGFFLDKPYDIYLSNDNNTAYLSMGADNEIRLMNPPTGLFLSAITVQGQPRGLFMSPDATKLYVTNYSTKSISVIDLAANKVINTIPVGANPIQMDGLIPFGSGCNPVTYTIKINPSPPTSITASNNLVSLNTVYGTASTSESFTVSGNNLTTGILVTPPTGFEISTDNVKFYNTVTVGSEGNIAQTPVYIRLASSSPAGSYSGNVILTSQGATTVNTAIGNSVVTPAHLNIIADNKTKVQGSDNPILTVTYDSFVNNDSPTQLINQPQINTTASTSSTAGIYPIIVSNALSPNYTISYIQGILTVTSPPTQSIIIPNTFTPNGDGINDVWNIKSLDNYPNCIVAVYNRYGNLLFQSKGYTIPWDGNYKGHKIPAGVYYYVINLQNGTKELSGYITLIR